DAISVRETFAKDYLMKVLDKKIDVISDPTFLLSREEWIDKLASKSKYYKCEEKYILTYFVSKEKNSRECIQFIKNYSQKYNYPVWSIQFSTYYSKTGDKKILGASMEDFLALVLNAQIIITDSFHGTALSLNLEKNFVSYNNSENPLRVHNLLNRLHLLERINMDYESYKTIDYKNVRKGIDEIRKESQEWIVDAIE
ncbi:MAG: polysaccharide pyruvyl transferase family protein, partial [Acetatifactor sp.]|nr:polysaccharide pyruvyl transferase family protein [Acetatifactor sp.]